MSIRRDPIYISTDVWRWLRLLAKSKSSEGKIITVDEIADTTLRGFLDGQYPQLGEHEKKVSKLEKETIASLSKKS